VDVEHAIVISRTPRCAHTLLTKPECHCPACLAEQLAAHRPAATAAQVPAGEKSDPGAVWASPAA
jgi:hypothetical protein